MSGNDPVIQRTDIQRTGTTPRTGIWRIGLTARERTHDGRGQAMLAAARQAGFAEVTDLRATRLYLLDGELSGDAVETLARELFANPVVESWECEALPSSPKPSSPESCSPESPDMQIEVHLQPGVMDPVALSAVDAARDLLATLPGQATQANSEPCATALEQCFRIDEVRTAWRYTLCGVESLEVAEAIAKQVLANPCMETIYVYGMGRCDALPNRFPRAPELPFEKRTVKLSGLDDEALARLSREAHLFLSVEEMRAIRTHFASLKRDPTDLELETLAQTWSEHCVHKTLKAEVVYRGRAFGEAGDSSDAIVEKHYDNLLKDTIVRATYELDKPWCLSVFVDNAGVIAFDDDHGIAFKVETHNHPSALDPYGGAATGAGGCIRDILGCGLGAKPIANTDVFCLADPNYDDEKIPPGVLKPRRVLRGVVSGVRDYGNRMGIPTVAGALYFDNRYLANPLVFCGCVGLIPRDRIEKEPRAGDCVVVLGGRTGRDGIGGATFSSSELTDTHADEFAHAVQIGNAIEEKKVCDALLRARDHEGGCLYSSLTDCGAGGLSSAVGEMGETLGATVDLEKVPLKYAGLRYNEIWLSEAQERMVMSVPANNLDALLRICDEEEVEATVIGTFTGDGELVLRYEGTEVGRLDVEFLHNGIPKRRMTARWEGAKPPSMPAIDASKPAMGASGSGDALNPLGNRLGDRLIERLRHLNVCSREAVFRQYDHEVQGATVIKPSAGAGGGPSDGAVIRPVADSLRGIALGAGLCPQLSDDDPYWMAIFAIDEAIRNVVAVGAHPERIAILDNFCWGGCDDEEEMGSLVRACQACYDAALAYETPFISGKDSLNNQFSLDAEDARRIGLPPRLTIPATLLISAMGIVDNVTQCVTSDLKASGGDLVHVSVDLRRVGPRAAAAMHRAVAHYIRDRKVRACHDVSDGGLAVCLAEMCIGGLRGAVVDIGVVDDASDEDGAGDGGTTGALFDESLSGYVLQLAPDVSLADLEQVADVVALGRVSEDVNEAITLRFTRVGETVCEWDIETLATAWRSPISLGQEGAGAGAGATV